MAKIKDQKDKEISAMKPEPAEDPLNIKPLHTLPPTILSAPTTPQGSASTPHPFGSTLGGSRRRMTTEAMQETIKQKEMAKMVEQGLIPPPF